MRYLLLGLVLIGMVCATHVRAAAPKLPMLGTKGARVVDERGNPVTLRGCNLGNWLLIEAWMLGWDIEDQETLIRVLTERFGAAEADRLMTLYRDGYITSRDFDLLKTFGFNVVRLPFDSRTLIDDAGTLRPDAFKYLDRCLEMAEQAGIYVILDMHGAPGGQSNMDHTGLRNQNKLWFDPARQQQMVDLWRTIADRYKDRTVVAAYDMLNEPYGDYQMDMRPALRELMPRCYEAIRSTGDKHMVIFPNTLGSGITFYGDLKGKGYTQIAFTDHYYAGLFGSPSTVRSHAGMFFRAMPEAQAYLEANDAAMLIGEFNVVLEQAGGDAMMRRYYDEFAERGWMATMWSYKLLKPAAGVQADNWYLVTNAEALPKVDVRTSSLAEIQAYFQQLATMPLAVDEPLRTALLSKTPPPMFLPSLPPLPSTAPKERALGPWALADVNTPIRSGLSRTKDGVSIIAAGADVFGTRDSFSFLQQRAPDKAMLIATVDSLADSDTWAKAGLMVRFGEIDSPDYASAPFVMVNTFTDGGIAFLVRDRQGGVASESKRVIGPLPATLAIVRDGRRVETFVQSGPDAWVRVGGRTIDSDAPACIGLVALSHKERLLTEAQFSQIRLSADGKLPGPITTSARPTIRSAGENLVRDPSFKSFASGSWNRWGDAISESAAGIRLGAETGLWQDIEVVPGESYALAIRVRAAGESPLNVAINLEATVDGKQVALADRGVKSSDIERGEGWSVLRVDAAAVSPTMRVLIRATPVDGAQAATVEIEEARLWRVGD